MKWPFVSISGSCVRKNLFVISRFPFDKMKPRNRLLRIYIYVILVFLLLSILWCVWIKDWHTIPRHLMEAGQNWLSDGSGRELYILEAYLDMRKAPFVTNITILGLKKFNVTRFHLTCLALVTHRRRYLALNKIARKLNFYEHKVMKRDQYETGMWHCGPIERLEEFSHFSPQAFHSVLIGFVGPEKSHPRVSKILEVPLLHIPPLAKMRTPQYNFSICLGPLYGQVSHRDFIHFMEMQSILGVENVYVHDYSATASNKKLALVFNYYAHESKSIKITYIKWTLPVDETAVYYYGQYALYQQCLYRSMSESNYTLFIDLDELIIPQPPMVTFHDLVTKTKFYGDTDPRCSMRFNMQNYFPPTFFLPNSTTRSNETVKYFVNLDAGTPLNSKCITRPQLVVSMEPHLVKHCLPGWTNVNNDKDALVHHYNVALCLPYRNDTRCTLRRPNDTSIFRYKSQFMMNIKKVEHDLNIY